MSLNDEHLSQWLEEQTAKQELLLAELAKLEPPAELLAELAEKSALAAEMLMAEQQRKAAE
jgi:hypothetical protein